MEVLPYGFLRKVIPAAIIAATDASGNRLVTTSSRGHHVDANLMR